MEFTQIIYNQMRIKVMKFCINRGVTPNMITIFNHILTLTLGCYFFSRGEYWGGLLGLMIMGINVMLDYLDGDLAKITETTSEYGKWIDSGFDVIIQNAIMGAIAMGCYHQYLPVVWIVIFFIANAGSNLVSFHYNQTFGFNSTTGNKVFRDFMDKKRTLINRFLKNLIDPTASFEGLALFTFRYWIVAGILLNRMPETFILITKISMVRAAIMFVLYALHQKGSKKLYVLQALAVLDEERNEFYQIRYSNSKKGML